MATAVKENEAIPKAASIEPAKEASGVDLSTIIGAASGILLISIAIIRGGDSETFLNLNSAFIVMGGTIATTLIAFPSKKILGMVPVIINAFKPDVLQPADYIDEIMTLATKYRSGGMKQLEMEERLLNNRHLKNGIVMIVDGYQAREIQEIMERELNTMVERHNAGQKILRFMAVQAPVFGMAGTLIGLIQMLMRIADPSSIGPSLATALITTFYGLMLANLIITPVVAKLNARTESEATLLKAIRVGVMGIHDRINPMKIQRNMNALLPPDKHRNV